jgi:hypothetical protein
MTDEEFIERSPYGMVAFDRVIPLDGGEKSKERTNEKRRVDKHS